MTFIDRIADARDLADVFDLVNEFIVGLHHAHQIQPKFAMLPQPTNWLVKIEV